MRVVCEKNVMLDLSRRVARPERRCAPHARTVSASSNPSQRISIASNLASTA
ncbi:hypothetical protein [Haladaptatus sp.]|uniref:hypothetical protein n=1 Tax=Haladaptatus sp. TaxID=1973141 RepID=UPI003C5FAD8D